MPRDRLLMEHRDTSKVTSAKSVSLPRENNLDVVRLALAWIVVLVHSYDLSLRPALRPLPEFLSSGAAVEGFFAISGCLIVASWDRAPNAPAYFRRRAQRILPAYLAALVYTLVLGMIFTTLPLRAFLASSALWKYIGADLLFANFVHPDMPGVFHGNPASAANGALWTIKVEVAFYLVAPVLVSLCRRFSVPWVLSITFVLSAMYHLLLQPKHDLLAKQLPGQLTYFAVGAAFYFYYGWLQRRRVLVGVVATLLVVLGIITGQFLIQSVGIPLFTLAISFFTPLHRGITRFGDFSYGTYVLHYPTLQAFIAMGLFASAWKGLGLAAACVAVLAFLSWHFVERPFLRAARVRRVETAVA